MNMKSLFLNGNSSACIKYIEGQINAANSNFIWLSVDLVTLSFRLSVTRSDYEEFVMQFKCQLEHAFPECTFLVSTFNFDFPKNKLFDVRSTPGQTGAFGNILLKKFPCLRTKDVFYSFVTFGKNSSFFLDGEYFSSTGEGSIFAKLIENNAIVISIGHHWIKAASFVHHAEDKANVPYRYNKKFSGEIVCCDGLTKGHSQHFLVRDLDICEHSSFTLASNAVFFKSDLLRIGVINLANSHNVVGYTVMLKGMHQLTVSSLLSSEVGLVDFIPISGMNADVVTAKLANTLYKDDLISFNR